MDEQLNRRNVKDEIRIVTEQARYPLDSPVRPDRHLPASSPPHFRPLVGGCDPDRSAASPGPRRKPRHSCR